MKHVWCNYLLVTFQSQPGNYLNECVGLLKIGNNVKHAG